MPVQVNPVASMNNNFSMNADSSISNRGLDDDASSGDEEESLFVSNNNSMMKKKTEKAKWTLEEVCIYVQFCVLSHRFLNPAIYAMLC